MNLLGDKYLPSLYFPGQGSLHSRVLPSPWS